MFLKAKYNKNKCITMSIEYEKCPEVSDVHKTSNLSMENIKKYSIRNVIINCYLLTGILSFVLVQRSFFSMLIRKSLILIVSFTVFQDI